MGELATRTPGELCDAADSREPGALKAFRARLDADPSIARRFSDVRAGVVAAILDRCSASEAGGVGERRGTREVLERQLEAVEADLAGPEPTAVETLVARRAALDDLLLHSSESSDVRRPA